MASCPKSVSYAGGSCLEKGLGPSNVIVLCISAVRGGWQGTTEGGVQLVIKNGWSLKGRMVSKMFW